MPLLRGKSRIVTFRVTEEEFQVLSRACLNSAARSLSGFARDAIFEKVQRVGSPRFDLSGDLVTLSKTLEQLDDALREASNRIRRLLGPTGEGPSKDRSQCG